ISSNQTELKRSKEFYQSPQFYKAEIICHGKVVRIPLPDGKVFPDDLSGLLPIREIEFRIELTPRATPVSKSPYRLAPSELEKFSGQLKEL
ncbi:hypothetical protein Tco_1278730, partial [Tanacetum coccineum]